MNANDHAVKNVTPMLSEGNVVPGFDPLKLLIATPDGPRLTLPYKKLWFHKKHLNGRIRLSPLRITDQLAIIEASVFLDRKDAEPASSYIAEVDLSKYFDTLNHELLMELLRKQIHDKRVTGLIKKYLKAGVMENGVTTKTKEGSPQGGPLSPLLANIYLNEFDQEMARRGVKMVRYADDIVVVTKSKRAAEHMLESCRKFLEGKLKLTMNLQKSKVVSLFSIRNFKFLGCCLGKNGRGIYIRVHRNSLQKAKQKLRELTNRSQGRNVRMVMAKVKEFIRGWIGYFYIADMKRILQSWDKWLRRRIRMYIWKQWKKPKTRVQNLKKLGIPEWQAYQWGNTRLGYWRVAGSAILSRSITNEKLALAGYYDFPAQYEQIRKLHLCD